MVLLLIRSFHIIIIRSCHEWLLVLLTGRVPGVGADPNDGVVAGLFKVKDKDLKVSGGKLFASRADDDGEVEVKSSKKKGNDDTKLSEKRKRDTSTTAKRSALVDDDANNNDDDDTAAAPVTKKAATSAKPDSKKPSTTAAKSAANGHTNGNGDASHDIDETDDAPTPAPSKKGKPAATTGGAKKMANPFATKGTKDDPKKALFAAK
jgi:hypothetical protein